MWLTQQALIHTCPPIVAALGAIPAFILRAGFGQLYSYSQRNGPCSSGLHAAALPKRSLLPCLCLLPRHAAWQDAAESTSIWHHRCQPWPLPRGLDFTPTWRRSCLTSPCCTSKHLLCSIQAGDTLAAVALEPKASLWFFFFFPFILALFTLSPISSRGLTCWLMWGERY